MGCARCVLIFALPFGRLANCLSDTFHRSGQSFDGDEGLIKPFSVAMPDVQYPTGIYPFKFTCSSEVRVVFVVRHAASNADS